MKKNMFLASIIVFVCAFLAIPQEAAAVQYIESGTAFVTTRKTPYPTCTEELVLRNEPHGCPNPRAEKICNEHGGEYYPGGRF